MQTTIIITNSHHNGFAFAWDAKSNEQVYIPVHVAAGHNISAGDSIEATLVPNFSDKSREGTPWQAVKLHLEATTPKPKPAPKIAEPTPDQIVRARDELDAHVLEFISACDYATTSEIASAVGVEPKTAGNSAQRHYNSGRIARADVYHRTGQSRPSFVLYAANAQNFVDES
jgi:hypothetical protein